MSRWPVLGYRKNRPPGHLEGKAGMVFAVVSHDEDFDVVEGAGVAVLCGAGDDFGGDFFALYESLCCCNNHLLGEYW